MVRWRVFRPAAGMKVTIKVGGSKLEGEVLQTDMTGDVVDTAYISAGGNTSKVVICSGKWQVWGYQAEHAVYFSNRSESPQDYSQNSPQQSPQQSPPDSPLVDDYDDIALV